MFTISFQYNGHTYNAIVTEKDRVSQQYRITIMNGELERLLHGNNVICIDEMLAVKQVTSDAEKLLVQINQSLKNYLLTKAVSEFVEPIIR